jgi:hypothetical protein
MQKARFMLTVPVAVASIARIGQPDILCDEAAVVFRAEGRNDFHCAQKVAPAHQRMETGYVEWTCC